MKALGKERNAYLTKTAAQAGVKANTQRPSRKLAFAVLVHDGIIVFILCVTNY